MTSLPSSRVPLLLETTTNTKPACSAAKLRGMTAFCHGEAPDWAFWCAYAKTGSGEFRSIDFKFDRSTSGKVSIDRLLSSIDRLLRISDFPSISLWILPLPLIDLQNIKTQKLTKASENNKAKGLTSINQGVQIHNIWHSSNTPKLTFC